MRKMEIDIRKNIKVNFKNSKIEDIKSSIEEAILENDEITLPGLGVFFEVLWNNSDDGLKNVILNSLEKNI